MPFNNYNSRFAKSIFKSSAVPSILSPQSASRNTGSQEAEQKTLPLSKSLKENLERTRALVDLIKKEKYDTDLELSRLGEKAAARARIEAAQRASLDESLREDALEELRRHEYPGVIEKLNSDLEPQVRAEVLAKLELKLRPKVHAELRDELIDNLTGIVRTELKGDQKLRDEAISELKDELRDELDPVIREELYPQIIAELKEEYRIMVLEQLKGELAAEAASQINDINDHTENALGSTSRTESEVSDYIHASSETAGIAKRRHSDTFQGEYTDVRKKRLRMINLSGEPPVKAGSLPPFGTFALYSDLEVNPVDDILEGGGKADVEDEKDSQEQPAIGDKSLILRKRINDFDQVVKPMKIHIEAVNEAFHSSQDDQLQSDEDADAESEEPVLPDQNHGPETSALDPQLQELQIPNSSAQEDDKTDPLTLTDDQSLSQSSHIFHSIQELPDIAEVPKQADHEKITETEIKLQHNPPYAPINPSNDTILEHDHTNALAEEQYSSTNSNSEDDYDFEWNYADRHDPTAPPYYASSRFGPDEDAEDEDRDEDEEYNEDDAEGPRFGGWGYQPKQYASEGDVSEQEEDEEEEGGDDSDETEEQQEEEQTRETPAVNTIYHSAGATQNEPIELDSD